MRKPPRFIVLVCCDTGKPGLGGALISRSDMPWGINRFGFVVDDVKAIEDAAQTTAVAKAFCAVAESWIRDPEGNLVDISQPGWPI